MLRISACACLALASSARAAWRAKKHQAESCGAAAGAARRNGGRSVKARRGAGIKHQRKRFAVRASVRTLYNVGAQRRQRGSAVSAGDKRAVRLAILAERRTVALSSCRRAGSCAWFTIATLICGVKQRRDGVTAKSPLWLH